MSNVLNKKTALTYNIRRLDNDYIPQAAFLRRNYPVQVQRVPAVRNNLQQQTDLSSKELPQGLVGLVQYCNGALMSILLLAAAMTIWCII
jgi:hypothetical protein